MTNHEMIKRMDAEELSYLIDGGTCTMCINRNKEITECKSCRAGIKAWLEKEASDVKIQ